MARLIIGFWFLAAFVLLFAGCRSYSDTPGNLPNGWQGSPTNYDPNRSIIH